ncbi:hypothetical protein Glove_326g242 [Diversispora epigaea]|uniref:FAR1 domain-containing protein n=1 Tax=Diversispora epigaea TaxID=1348612 RepID=A0A397HSF4_9GLOM|nr:hypothetical protein Glove_326g242 [Diversispora epigaea]
MDVHIQEELDNNGHDNVTQPLPLQQKKTNIYLQLYERTEPEIISIQDDIEHTGPEIISIQDDIEQYEDKSNDITPQNSENEIMNLCVGCVFNSWENIDAIMEAYGKKHGFTIIKKRLMRHENGNIKHRSFGCEFGGRHQPKKQVDINKHHDRKSKRQQCAWNANFNCSQNSQNIVLTTFNNLHNHPLFLNAEEFSPKFRCIPDNALEEIQFLTKHGNLSINIQQKLLKAKFPALSILDCDLANTIQKYKVKTDIAHDASQLLRTLIQYKSNDPGWYVEF